MKTKRSVLMFSYPFPPAASGGVFRILRFARYLPQSDWTPLVVTPRVKSVTPISIDESLYDLIPEGLAVERTRVLRPSIATKAFVKRILEGIGIRRDDVATDSGHQSRKQDPSIRQSQSKPRSRNIRRSIEKMMATPDRHIGWLLPAVAPGLREIRRSRPHVIYTTGPPHSTHLIGVILKRLSGLPLVLDFRDPWAAREWTTDAPHSTRVTSTERFESVCVQAADQVILNTPAVRDAFIAVYGDVRNAKFRCIPNGFDPSLVAKVEGLVCQYGPADVNGTLKLCHAGSAWGKRDLRPLAKAVEIAASGDYRVEMEQVGAVSPALRPPDALESADCRSVFRCVGELPHHEALEHMARANILVLIQPDNTLQIPGKLYEMLPFRKPILALTGRGATGDLVEQLGVGQVVDPSDPQAIASSIHRIVQTSLLRRDPTPFDRALERFDGRRLTRDLADVFDSAAAE